MQRFVGREEEEEKKKREGEERVRRIDTLLHSLLFFHYPWIGKHLQSSLSLRPSDFAAEWLGGGFARFLFSSFGREKGLEATKELWSCVLVTDQPVV